MLLGNDSAVYINYVFIGGAEGCSTQSKEKENGDKGLTIE